jgi:DNA-binding CsgD family transcriptional regulator
VIARPVAASDPGAYEAAVADVVARIHAGEIFQAIVAGDSVTDIAQKLNLSVKTVSTHKMHVMEKMGCDNVADLVRYAIQHKLLAGGSE